AGRRLDSLTAEPAPLAHGTRFSLPDRRKGRGTMDRLTRKLSGQALENKLHERANAAVTEERVRETLLFLGFDEVAPGYFVRLDAPDGRADDAHAARYMTSVRVDHVRGNAAALERIVRRFSRVHGKLER